MSGCVWSTSFYLDNLLFKYVHWCLVGLELLVFEEDLPSQLQRRRQVRVITEVTLKEEARHEPLPKHRLRDRHSKARRARHQ